ncbi:amino-acid transporter subunit; membrane component of ABC superfamily [Desulfamplus magnetovallimortis]|uniref:Amino-acid transporter subunit membrane component of ABC superfamily n=1 Tax=Desulfamplus magnetovallimortis TaxID=1246637 RepID=A0A1W1H4R9_9BACT|nr:amino acid ABC transporter permease [Desulfamplus magnetovallimortis]SLM27469.1 amino-acid transporter subunit; membrane component of ABC superfamily [Desulfamplus magnetovallimortis]
MPKIKNAEANYLYASALLRGAMPKDNNSEPIWTNATFRARVYQVAAMSLVALTAYYLFTNTLANLEKQSIATGFGFLSREASFEIGESIISFSSSDTYLRALWVGALNTIKVSFIGIILTVLIGIVMGIARLSTNWLVSRLAGVYIEVLQDIPILLQLFFWYGIFNNVLPSPRQAMIPMEGVVLCNRGAYFAIPADHPAFVWMGYSFVAAVVVIFILRKWAKKRQEETGKIFPILSVSSAIIIAFPLFVWLIGGAPTELNMPVLKGFNFEGGYNVSPEFGSLLLGLVLYTSAFVAEIVRAGIQSIVKGQREAAEALGLKPLFIMNLVILPQALRVIIPPLTSQLLNLTKNSSLAVAIGYPDFVSVSNTTISQTGQAIEGVALIMIMYLTISLLTSLFMNWYNSKMALVER